MKLLKKEKSLRLLSPVLKARKGFHKEYALAAEKAGFKEMLIDGKLTNTEEFQPLARHKAHDIDFVVAQVTNKQPLKKTSEALTVALQYGKGTFRVLTEKGNLQTFSTARVSPVTGESFEELDPHHFSFNSPRGWCQTCRGYGHITNSRFDTKGFNSQAEAEIHEEKLAGKANPDDLRVCPDCHGARLRENSRHVFIDGQSLPDLSLLNVQEARKTISTFEFKGRGLAISRDILPEIIQRLKFLEDVGLGYLNWTAQPLPCPAANLRESALLLNSDLIYREFSIFSMNPPSGYTLVTTMLSWELFKPSRKKETRFFSSSTTKTQLKLQPI